MILKNLEEEMWYLKEANLFIAQVASNPNIKSELGKIYNSADRYVQKL